MLSLSFRELQETIIIVVPTATINNLVPIESDREAIKEPKTIEEDINGFVFGSLRINDFDC